MLLYKKFLILFAVAVITACVTINVYFPSAEVEDAAEQIIKDVIGVGDSQGSEVDSAYQRHEVGRESWSLNPVNWFIGAAHAQNVNIELSSPAINDITARMKSRFSSSLKQYLNTGVVGFTNQGFVEAVNPDKLDLRERQKVKKIIADENRDRKALYRELAVANNHPEWETQIQQVFVKEWIDEAQVGWYYQNAQNQWQKK